MAIRKWDQRKKATYIICISCYAIAPIFFILLYLLMTMSYEDILHRSWHSQDSASNILAYVYHYLPRLGEFYQHLTMRFMDIQASLGFGIVLRLFDAAMCTALIYLLTVFVLKRRPQLTFRDALIYLGFFVLLMLFETCEVFMYRFSYIHNYVIAALVTIGFLLPYRLRLQSSRILPLAGMVLLGFLFGISSEIAPIAVIIILGGVTIIYKLTQKITAKQFTSKYRLQIAGVAGILLGLIFFYVGAGIEGRANGNYGVAYEYVHLTELFSAPLRTIAILIDHFWYNSRYCAFAIVLLLFILFSEFTHYKQGRKNQFWFHLCILIFCVLFLGASALIKLHDDIYVRFLFPVYVAIFISLLTFIYEQLVSPDSRLEALTRVSSIALLGLSALITIDMAFGMARYHLAVSPSVRGEIIIQDDGSIVIPSNSPKPYMISSPIFHFRQLTPFDWDSSNIYMKYNN